MKNESILVGICVFTMLIFLASILGCALNEAEALHHLMPWARVIGLSIGIISVISALWWEIKLLKRAANKNGVS